MVYNYSSTYLDFTTVILEYGLKLAFFERKIGNKSFWSTSILIKLLMLGAMLKPCYESQLDKMTYYDPQ